MRQVWTSARWKVAVVAAATLAIGGGMSGPRAQAGPIVPGFERFGRHAADGPGRIEAGIVLIGELGCANCHEPSQAAAAHLTTKTGPVLTGVGNRIRPEWFREHLLDPQAGKSGVTMPKSLAGLPEAERKARLTAITHYLASTGSVDEGGFAEQSDGKQGRTVHDAVGCAACHGRLGGEDALPDAVPLGDLASKWTPRGLEAFLKDPLAVRPASRMPRLPLGDGDRRHLVAALLGPLPAAAAVDAGIVAFRGRSWPARVTTLPAAATLGEPEHAALVKGFDVAALAGRRNDFVAHLDGFLHVRRAGTHRFYLSSDDGSRLVVKETTVVENDGIHPHTERQGAIDLAVGVHPIRIEYFEAGGQQSLTLDVTAPGIGRISALGLVTPQSDGTPHAPPPSEDPAGFRVEPALAAEGRTAFTTSRCAACHVLEDEQRGPLAESARPGPLESLAGKATAGCLAPSGGDGDGRLGGMDATRVDYGLDDAQREAIAQALEWLASPAASRGPDDPQAIDRMLTSLNCYACHTRAATPDGPAKGGVVPAVATVDEDGEPILKDPARDSLFASTVQELGDEGRLPPTLTGVGDKLTADFLREVLLQGGKDRGLVMRTLMPAWHGAAVGPLAERFLHDVTTVAAVPPLDGFAARDVEEAGRFLSGSKGLGCIKCHAFGGERGQSQGVVDMVRMPKRLRHEWFLAYVADPQRFRRGTRMPAAWPEGKAFHADVLGGTAANQIEGVWRYLAAASPKAPIGASANPIELVPSGTPIIYRNFIEGAGSRAIGVGFPEQVNVAFDAEALRLALVWRGAFIDAGRHWSGRGPGFQPPLGEGVFTPDLAAAVEVLPAKDGAWPEAPPRDRGGRFKGYRLDEKGRPTFTWTLAGLTVSESIGPAAAEGGRPVVRRTLSVAGTPPSGVALLRAAVGGRIDEEPGAWWRVDGNWRLRLGGDVAAPVVTDAAGGRKQLRAEIRLGGGGTATIVEDLSW